MLRGQKGITLVALVITVIVLLILAGVALSMINSGDANSLFTRSGDAANLYTNAAKNENDAWTGLVGDFNNYYDNAFPASK